MIDWKKKFEEIHELKSDFAPNEPEQRMFKSGYDIGVESQELERLRGGIKSIINKEINPYDKGQALLKFKLQELLKEGE